MKRWGLLCLLLVFCGLIDCVSTVVGIVWFGATEGNPLFTALTETNLLAFSAIKLAFVVLVGVLFYKAGSVGRIEGNSVQVGTRFIQVAYSLSLLTMLTVVTNNVLVAAQLL